MDDSLRPTLAQQALCALRLPIRSLPKCVVPHFENLIAKFVGVAVVRRWQMTLSVQRRQEAIAQAHIVACGATARLFLHAMRAL